MTSERRLIGARRAGPPFAVGVLAVLGTLPAVTAVEPPIGGSRWIVVLLSVGVGVGSVGIAAAVGATLADDVGLRTFAADRLPGGGLGAYRLPVVAGVGVALLTLGVSAVAGALEVAPGPIDRWAGGGWQGVVASVAGGVVTELVLRFGVMTLVVWTAWTYRPAVDGGVTRASAWTGVLAAALLGSCAAIPAAVAAGADPGAVAVAAAVPFLGGVVFGALYWRYDLAAAVVAHAVGSALRALVGAL